MLVGFKPERITTLRLSDLLTKEELEELYTNKEMSMQEIASYKHCSVGGVHKMITLYGITARQHPSEKTRLRMSESRKGKYYRATGWKMPDETKRKISESRKGLVFKPSKYGGHTKKRADGYIAVYVPNHPKANGEGYVMEHRLVMEEHIGRYVSDDEVVHHVNGIRDDNRIENLRLMNAKEHSAFHTSERNRNGTINHFKVRVKNTTTGEEFDSIKEAGAAYGVSATSVIDACDTGRKCRNCHWERISSTKERK